MRLKLAVVVLLLAGALTLALRELACVAAERPPTHTAGMAAPLDADTLDADLPAVPEGEIEPAASPALTF
ncbi:MAG: hypothetical protein ACREM3_26045 [Candidatus Rokuibacteriota bacterium]